ncbi:heat shock gene repressor HrcA [Rubidibacter lacunae KORDI 51-2]|uniref:Heat-inducible transcription repressor HrcA n=1 Tax=Rubidibacter lacunae KORDI 51-2 TaxID=582515 RepID=U5DFN2_9CHRO|nr:heat-inducible transcriptional repressor HrcA [Rubidibacter lacunae]ERN40406.1 heat shock gene repressor HrcA [Rubidibacter lacunae KORDI 51-2]
MPSRPPKLSDRHQQVLSATVRHYVATAEPVSSKVLASEYDFSVSSATIRNAMGWLEKAGLLYQPHTSAGRVPSDSGYRIYVDRLMTPDLAFGPEIEQLLAQTLQNGSGSIEALLQGATQLLSTLSGYVALITRPRYPTRCLRHLQLVRVDSERVMLILVTDAYETRSVLLQLPVDGPATGAATGATIELADGELQMLSNYLNSKLRGRSLTDLATLDWGELDRDFQTSMELLRQVLVGLVQEQAAVPSPEIVVRGIAEVLRQPEFSELHQVQMLLHLLEEEQDRLWPLVFEVPRPDAPARRVTVRIGSENPLGPMQTCTLIAANYSCNDTPVGSVGIIGPTRMLYENAIALVETAADYLTEVLRVD